METPIEKFEMWARVDLFGHNQRVGKLSVTNTGVEILYRLDIPIKGGETKTEFYGKGAVYSILPVSEEVAHLIAMKLGEATPISQWDLPESWREAIRSQGHAVPALLASNGESGNRDQDELDEDDDTGDDDPGF